MSDEMKPVDEDMRQRGLDIWAAVHEAYDDTGQAIWWASWYSGDDVRRRRDAGVRKRACSPSGAASDD